MEHPIRTAFCPLLFASNGGKFKEDGIPIFERGIRGNCDRAWDCGTCPVLTEWVKQRELKGVKISWECWICLVDTKDTPRFLPGFFHSGQPDDPDEPGLNGCTRCGRPSPVLQLVLRK